MGQAVTVANASGDKLYVKVQSSVEVSGSEKADLHINGSAPSTSATTASASGDINVEVDEKALEPGFVAIDDGQSLTFARSIFTRRLLTISKPNSKDLICNRFLVPCSTNVIVVPTCTIHFARTGHTWVDIDGIRYKDKKSKRQKELNNKL